MIKETTSAGGLVFRFRDNKLEIVVGYKTSNYDPKWGNCLIQLPKGKVEFSETLHSAAQREVAEETGYKTRILAKIGTASWSYSREDVLWNETVHYFLMEVLDRSEKRDTEFDEVHWIEANELLKTLSYPEEREVLESLIACIDGGEKDREKSGKASWLRNLEKVSLTKRSFVVDNFITFSIGKWMLNPNLVLASILGNFAEKKTVILRSAVIEEDSLRNSHAGEFLSKIVHDIECVDTLKISIGTVIDSFRKNERDINIHDEVIVQNYVNLVGISGVVFTKDIWENKDYYLINFDDSGFKSDIVTSGMESKTLRIPRNFESIDDVSISVPWNGILKAIIDIEAQYPNKILDIEFALDQDEIVHIFQAREIACERKDEKHYAEQHNLAVQIVECQKNFCENCISKISLLGSSTLFSDMSDWNPAEILGDNPNPLDISLYRILITAEAWSLARNELGYRSSFGNELLFNLGIKPYVDVRTSLNTLTPSVLEEDLASRIIDASIGFLENNKNFHDKLEFEVAFSCYDFSTEERLRRIGFEHGEITKIASSLREHTIGLIDKYWVNSRADMEQLDLLNDADIRKVQPKNAREHCRFVAEYIRECREFGAHPFSRIARYAFVAVSLLRTALDQGIISKENYDDALGSVETISSTVSRMCRSVLQSREMNEEFIKQCGHLRPRMYNIRSLPYSEMSSDFWSVVCKSGISNATYTDNSTKISDLHIPFEKLGYRNNIEKFIQESIELREMAKFKYSKRVSQILEEISQIGSNLGISREELSYLEVEDLESFCDFENDEAFASFLINRIESRKSKWSMGSAVFYPNIVSNTSDFIQVFSILSQPTYVTGKTVVGKCLLLDNFNKIDVNQISQRIVCIDAADPGFDWIFAVPPLGLITKFGGAASHMAIRCGEFGLPAAIGCGEAIFSKVANAQIVELKCEEKQIIPYE